MSANGKPTWNFPPLNGGQDVVQDPASEFFTDNPIAKLVRETVQNSLDSKKDGLADPVKVTFTESSINRDLFDGAELRKHLRACHERVAKDGLDREIGRFYREAERTLSKNVRVLSIVDTGTTGLDDEAKWKALVRQEGAVNKQGAVSGGSFGIGKNAVFNVSALRAVLYSTRYLERRRGRQERMQAKSTLMSHPSPNGGKDLQHVGFLEWKGVKNYAELPQEFRLDDTGTGVFILGFDPQVGDREWIDATLRAVVENFFYAIHVVEIKSRGARAETVNRDTIGVHFERLYRKKKPEAYYYHRAICEEAKTVELDSNLGRLNLYLHLDEGAPRRTAYINRMGMLISDSREQKYNPAAPVNRGLWPNFAAVVVPDTDEGDKWSRRMETPSHDAVSPERLKDPKEGKKAYKIFQDARSAVRSAIDDQIGTGEFLEESNIHELSEILPDEFDPNLPGNRALVSEEGRPPPNRMIEDIEDDDDDAEESEGEDWEDGREDRENDEDENEDDEDEDEDDDDEDDDDDDEDEDDDDDDRTKHPRRTTTRDNVPQPRARLGKPRYIADGEDAYSCTVAFELSEAVEHITLTLRPAGAERGEKMRPIRVASASLLGQDLDCDEGGAIQIPNPPTGQRLAVKIETAESIANRAIVARGNLKA